jgi:purine-binding chemotaxis protein CheW
MNKAEDNQGQMDDFWVEDDDTSQTTKYLFFNLGDDLYGINIIDVTEIIEMQKITGIPDLPGYLRGVINLRGRVIPVTDLRRRFGMDDRPYDDRTCIIVTDIDSAALGMIVDTVAEVYDVPPENIEHSESISQAATEHYVEGVARVEERVAVLIDARKILRDQDLQAMKQDR